MKMSGALGHFVFADVGHDEALAAEFMRTLDARGEYGVRLRRVGAYDKDQRSFFNIGDGAGIGADADSALQAHGGGSLAVAAAVVDVVGADDLTSELLHQVRLFIGALRRGDKGQGRQGP